MMRLKHRCNSLGQILEAQQLGYDGVEVDLVWGGPGLRLSHTHGGVGPLLDGIIDAIPADMFLAINVKEYGMADELQRLFGLRSHYFIFDVPGPELEAYDARNLRYLGRFSEYEVQTSEHGKIVDSFESNASWVKAHLCPGDALISPTLRGLPEWGADVLEQATFLVTK